jgi:hypothetical protein
MLATDYALILLSMLLFSPLNKLTKISRRQAHGGARLARLTRPIAAGLVVGSPVISWWVFGGERFAALEHLQGLIVFIEAILTWRFVTRDFDVTEALPPQRRARMALVACAVVSFFYTPVLLIWLYISRNWLPDWQHHVTMPARMIQMFLTLYMSAWLLHCIGYAISAPLQPGITPYVLLLGCVQASHYLKPGLSKLSLGPKWSDWLLHNRTDMLAISAYNWGWANFLPSATAHKLVSGIAPWIVALNGLTLLIEVSPILAFLHVQIFTATLVAMSLLNLAIFLLSGILFWEYILTNLAFGITLTRLSAEPATLAFGLETFLVSLGVLAFPVIFDQVWHPTDLAWWDGPFIARLRWRVEGVSGRIYGLYNNFMCPYERQYGRMHGYFLVNEKIVHGHLGLVKDFVLRERLLQTRGDRQELDKLKREFGVSYFDPAQAAEHERFLVTMFNRLNQGLKKNILPPWLIWLKAPGGQFFYWGPNPAYRRQEKVRRIEIYYNEKYYDDQNNRTFELCQRLVQTINL